MDNFFQGFAGALIGAFIGSVGTFFTLRYNYRHLFAETVSQSRNRWLNELREHLSVLLFESPTDGNGGKNPKYHIAKYQVLLRLNPNEPKHLLLTQLIAQLEQCKCEEKETIKQAILKTSENILKEEWARVKQEARGKENVL